MTCAAQIAETASCELTLFTRDGEARAAAHELLAAQLEEQLSTVLGDFEAAPSRAGLLELGTIAEVLVLGRDLPTGRRLASSVGAAAARWSQSGILESLCFTEAQLTYHIALLLLFAGGQPRDVLQALCDRGLIGRSEWPLLTQLSVSAMFFQCGLETILPKAEHADLTVRLDKRCLRAKSNEYDLSLLLTVAQLIDLRRIEQLRTLVPPGTPGMLPRLLLTQALRAGNWNWVAVLAFLCHRFFGLPEHLEHATRLALSRVDASPESLGLPPDDISRDTDYFERPVRGLRIRSGVGLALFIESIQQGEHTCTTRPF